ncbi:MAG: hypothetical protein ACRCVV_01550 [Shewanella sp.]
MADVVKNAMNLLMFLHWIGLVMLFSGLGLYLLTSWSLVLFGMVVIASLIGLGLVLISPYPVVLFVQWAKAQDDKPAS